MAAFDQVIISYPRMPIVIVLILDAVRLSIQQKTGARGQIEKSGFVQHTRRLPGADIRRIDIDSRLISECHINWIWIEVGIAKRSINEDAAVDIGNTLGITVFGVQLHDARLVGIGDHVAEKSSGRAVFLDIDHSIICPVQVVRRAQGPGRVRVAVVNDGLLGNV